MYSITAISEPQHYVFKEQLAKLTIKRKYKPILFSQNTKPSEIKQLQIHGFRASFLNWRSQNKSMLRSTIKVSK